MGLMYLQNLGLKIVIVTLRKFSSGCHSQGQRCCQHQNPHTPLKPYGLHRVMSISHVMKPDLTYVFLLFLPCLSVPILPSFVVT
jgi:hypothetical protein